jgi:hypothetical protein
LTYDHAREVLVQGDGEVNQESLSITVLGVDLRCFLCGQTIASGNHHECNKKYNTIRFRTWKIGDPRPSRSKRRGNHMAIGPS